MRLNFVFQLVFRRQKHTSCWRQPTRWTWCHAPARFTGTTASPVGEKMCTTSREVGGCLPLLPTKTSREFDSYSCRIVKQATEKWQNSLAYWNTRVHVILCEFLQRRKVSARFVPHTLTREQCDQRKTFTTEPDFAKMIITGDEMWCFVYDPTTKQQSAEWIAKHEPRPKKLKF